MLSGTESAGLPKEEVWPNPKLGFGLTVVSSGFASVTALVSPNLKRGVDAGAGAEDGAVVEVLPKLKVGALVAVGAPKADGADVCVL